MSLSLAGPFARLLAVALSLTFASIASFAGSVTDITFFAASDTHYGRVFGNAYDSLRIATVANLNALPGTPYPAALGGGPVAVPRGVVMPGDLIDRPYATRWKLFQADYGVNGEGKVKFPVYDGLGNHDVFNYGTGDTTDVIINSFIKRNALRKGIAEFDAKHLHYSWDWDQVHFVQMNLFAGTDIGAQPQWDPMQSLAFLKMDLEKHVGHSGRPVPVMQHFAVDTAQSDWQIAQKDALVGLLKGYNCIGILHGHIHTKAIYKYKGLDIFSDGAAFKGDMMVFRITEGKMFVGCLRGNSWSNLMLEKSVSMGAPVTAVRGRAREPMRAVESFTFYVNGLGRVAAANRRAQEAAVFRSDGALVRRMAAGTGSMEWDRKDNRGVTVPGGVYLIRIATPEGPVSAKVLLH